MKKRPFYAFCQNLYYENRDEYDQSGQTQPHTFREYLEQNISMLKEKYRLTYRKNRRIL
jgi:hypothetical protein